MKKILALAAIAVAAAATLGTAHAQNFPDGKP
ncbi:hypothetical protein SAMN05444747_1201, partial [Variovorax sp. OV329]